MQPASAVPNGGTSDKAKVMTQDKGSCDAVSRNVTYTGNSSNSYLVKRRAIILLPLSVGILGRN